MIDFHCHILPGLDDGPIDVSESIIMAARLAGFGYKAVCCTPHCIKGYYDFGPQKVREATLMLQADLDNADIHLDLWPGMEYMLDENFAECADNLVPLGPTRLVLCEAPQQAHHECVQAGLKLIVDKGFVPLIAHPERTQYFYEMLTEQRTQGADRKRNFEEDKSKFNITNLWPFKKNNSKFKIQNSKLSDTDLPGGVLFQANLGSFTGYYGPQVQSRAYELLKLGVYSAIASDLHDGTATGPILQHDKFALNPLLKKLAEWDGSVSADGKANRAGQGEQFGLF